MNVPGPKSIVGGHKQISETGPFSFIPQTKSIGEVIDQLVPFHSYTHVSPSTQSPTTGGSGGSGGPVEEELENKDDELELLEEMPELLEDEPELLEDELELLEDELELSTAELELLDN